MASERPGPNWRVILLLTVPVIVLVLAAIVRNFPASRSTGRLPSAMKNAKNIVLALHNYHDQNKKFPYGVVRNKTGKAMSGWRLGITPYLKPGMFADQYKSDQSGPFYSGYDPRFAWDDPKNLAVEQFSYEIFTTHRQQNKVPNATNFVLVTGPGTLFPDDGLCSLSDLVDGPNKTIVVVEIDDSDIAWYEPRDLRIDTMSFRINDPDRSKPCIGSRLSRGAIVGFADGRTELLPEDTPPEKLRAMLTIADGD